MKNAQGRPSDLFAVGRVRLLLFLLHGGNVEQGILLSVLKAQSAKARCIERMQSQQQGGETFPERIGLLQSDDTSISSRSRASGRLLSLARQQALPLALLVDCEQKQHRMSTPSTPTN